MIMSDLNLNEKLPLSVQKIVDIFCYVYVKDAVNECNFCSCLKYFLKITILYYHSKENYAYQISSMNGTK